MLGKILIVAGAVLVAVMGLSYATAQNAPTASSSKQGETAKYDLEVATVDQSGAIIPNADVGLIGPGKQNSVTWDFTNPSGRVRFPNQLAGKYTVQVSARGFQVAKESLDVPSQGEISVTLFADPLQSGYQGPGPFPPPVETITSSLEYQIPLPPAPSPAATPEPAPTPRRNPVARFFSAIVHKLGL